MFAQGDEGKFLAKEKLFSLLAFGAEGEAKFAKACVRRGIAWLTKVSLSVAVACCGLMAMAEPQRIWAQATHGLTAILHAPDSHDCLVFFDIWNEEYGWGRSPAWH